MSVIDADRMSVALSLLPHCDVRELASTACVCSRDVLESLFAVCSRLFPFQFPAPKRSPIGAKIRASVIGIVPLWSCHASTTATRPLPRHSMIPSNLLDRIQSVMKSAARLVFTSSSYDQITPLLRQLHWLKAAELAVLVYTDISTGPFCRIYSILLTNSTSQRTTRLDDVCVPLRHL